MRPVWFLGLVLLLGARGLAQCPERAHSPDPPGWAIDYSGPHGVSGATLSPNGKWIAFEADGATWLTDTGLTQRSQLIPCIEVASTLAFSPDSSELALGDGNGMIRIFEIPGGTLVREIRGEGWHQQLYWGPSGLLASVRPYGLSIWDTTSGRRVSDIDTLACGDRGTCEPEFFDDVEISPDGRLIATADRRTTFEITVRELSGRKLALLKGPNKGHNFLFDPENPWVLIVAEARDFVWWDVRSGRALKKVPRQEPDTGVLTSPAGIRPALLITDSYQARVFNRETGKLLDRWNAVGFTSITPDSRWALTWDLKIWHLPSETPVGQITYAPTGTVVAPWSVSREYLATRIRPKEPPMWLVLSILLLVGVTGFLLCRRFPWLLIFAIPAALTVTGWWVSELFVPSRGPGIASALGLPLTVLSLLTAGAALGLPVLGALRTTGNRVPPRLPLKWALPLLQVVLAALLIAASGMQIAADQERLQVEGDVRAGGELRGAALQPWYYSPSLFEFGTAVNAPIMLLQEQVCRWRNRWGVSIVALVLVGVLWWFVGAKLDGETFVQQSSLRLLARILAFLLAVAISASAVLRNNLGLHHGAPIFWISTIGFFTWSIVIIAAIVRGIVRERRSRAAAVV